MWPGSPKITFFVIEPVKSLRNLYMKSSGLMTRKVLPTAQMKRGSPVCSLGLIYYKWDKKTLTIMLQGETQSSCFYPF